MDIRVGYAGCVINIPVSIWACFPWVTAFVRMRPCHWRCQFHLQQNAMQYVPHVGMRREVAEDIRVIFNAPDHETAQMYLKKAVNKYALIAPKLADWMEVNIPEGFTVFSFPREHQKRLRTSNYLERLSQEIKRRTRVVRVFPNEQSCLRLVSAILMEVSEEWEYGKIYLRMESS